MNVPSRAAAELGVLDLAAAVRQRRPGPRCGSAIHGTGRPSCRAAAATAEYSAQSPALPPNPPPTCGAMTRIVARSIPSASASWRLQAVRHLRRGVEREPTVVAGDGGAAVRLHRHHGHALVDVAAAHDDVAAASRSTRSASVTTSAWFEPWSGKITGASSASASSGSMIAGERLVVGPHGGGGVGGRGRRVSARTTAIASPTKRTRVVGQRRPGEVGVDGDEAVVRRDAEVGGGEHGDDAGHRRRRRRCGRRRAGRGPTSERANTACSLPGQVEVVEVPGRTGEQRGVLGAQHPCPEDRASHRGNLPVAASARPAGDRRAVRSRTSAPRPRRRRRPGRRGRRSATSLRP